MKLRDKILYMSFGAMLVVLGMVLNSLVSGDADAQESEEFTVLKTVICESLFIADGSKLRGAFGLSGGDAVLSIYGDDGKTYVAYLGKNTADPNKEMVLHLKSESKTDKREGGLMIDEYGGTFRSNNKMGETVVRIGVGSDGGGVVDTRDKFGYRR